ncbi:MAG: acetoin utilization protein AcuC [Dehalococcoidia bacterium]|nr:acetoin utilization protein AcuC [Dehalococcoidia bacterium]
MKRAAFIYNDQMSRHVLRPDHVMKPDRLRYTYELLQAYGILDTASIIQPRLATEEELKTFHTPDYIQAVKSLSTGLNREQSAQFNFSDGGDNPIYGGMYESSLLSTGASVVGAELLLQNKADVSFNISGGLHHAMKNRASGFCIFNDPVIAINTMLAQNKRVAYIDIDCHHGDAVQAAYYDIDRVLTISTHESGKWLFPGTGSVDEIGIGKGRGYSMNVPLAPGTDDEVFLWAFNEAVLPAVELFKPDCIVTQLGVDTHYLDPITHMALTTQGFAKCVDTFSRMPYKWLALGGGGYDVSAVARSWTLAYSIMSGRPVPNEVPKSYQEKYGIKMLTDPIMPPIGKENKDFARQFAEESVRNIQKLVFQLLKAG